MVNDSCIGDGRICACIICMSEIYNLISKELELNGVRFEKLPWLSEESIINECIMAILPEVHEGKINSYGILFVENLNDLEEFEVIPMSSDQKNLAKKMSDGIEWFVLFEKGMFFGIIRFKVPLYDELKMIRNYPLNAGMLIKRNSLGITKYFQGDGIIIHDNRRWFNKPNIKEAAWKVSKCVANIDKRILVKILEFSFHLLSPATRAGGIIVWFLKNNNDENMTFSSLDLSILNESHARLLCHYLSQIDGAAFLDYKGDLIEAGKHLKYSDRTRKLVPELKGTRHTSSVRYSYEHEDSVVFTISEDGPITIFSNGSNIADLQVDSAFKKARIMNFSHPSPESKISSSSFDVICKYCLKTSRIEKVNVEGLDEKKQVYCTTCKKLIYSDNCSSLEGRSFKVLVDHG